MAYVIKIIVTVLVILLIAFVSKRSITIGAFLAGIPTISLLSLVWIYFDDKDVTKVIDFSYSVFWMTLPPLLFFIFLPILLKWGVKFWTAFISSGIGTALMYMLGLLLYRSLIK